MDAKTLQKAIEIDEELRMLNTFIEIVDCPGEILVRPADISGIEIGKPIQFVMDENSEVRNSFKGSLVRRKEKLEKELETL